MITVAPIVEGYGEVESLRILIERVWPTLGRSDWPTVLQPIRQPKGKLLQPKELERATNLAALKLGELDLLNNDMDWVRVLLTNAQIPDEALREFLQIYYQAAGEFLESPNEPILLWLQTEINRLKDSEAVT